MKFLRYLTFITLLAMPQIALSMAPQRGLFTWATIINRTGGPIRVTAFRPDPGFRGILRIVQDMQEIADEGGARIMVTTVGITAQPCSYQLPDAQGNYDLFHTDSIEIPIDPTRQTQTIILGDEESNISPLAKYPI